jgi:hypothetical protein
MVYYGRRLKRTLYLLKECRLHVECRRWLNFDWLRLNNRWKRVSLGHLNITIFISVIMEKINVIKWLLNVRNAVVLIGSFDSVVVLVYVVQVEPSYFKLRLKTIVSWMLFRCWLHIVILFVNWRFRRCNNLDVNSLCLAFFYFLND